MTKILKKARFVLNRSTVTGEVPTIPPNEDHTLGWINTDIYKGEFFVNTTDNRLWYRNDSDEFVEIVALSGGTIPEKYLDGPMTYQGTWDASSGQPPSTSPRKGYFYVVTVSGNTDLSGESDWQIGDYAVYNDPDWDKIDNSEPIMVAENVLYTNTDTEFSAVANVKDALNVVLGTSNTYTESTNIDIVDSGTGHDKTIAVIDNPTFSGLVTANLGLNVSGGNLTTTGTNDIVSSNDVKATSGRYTFNTASNYMTNNGSGFNVWNTNTSLFSIDSTLAGTGDRIVVTDSSGKLKAGTVPAGTYDTTLATTLAMPTPVGGFTAGTTVANVKGMTYIAMFDDLLFPTVLAYVGSNRSLVLNGVTTSVYEVGRTHTAVVSAAFNQGLIKNGDDSNGPALVGPATLYTFKLPGGTVDGTPSSTSTHTFASFTIAAPGTTYTWSVTTDYSIGTGAYYSNKGVAGTNLDGQRVSGSVSDNSNGITGQNRRYWGTNAGTTLSSAQVVALQSGTYGGTDLTASRAKSYSQSADNEYFYYCYPKRFGTATFVVGGLTVTWPQSEVSVTGAFGYTEVYYVYRTADPQNASGAGIVVS